MPPGRGTARTAFLPSDVDPTVFDEGFLRQLERLDLTVLGGRVARRQSALRGSGRVLRLLSDLSGVSTADGQTDLVAASRHAAAQLTSRGVIVLLSDLLDPAADRVIRELAATGSE